jgi:type II secretory pathway pseudopilin PulG
MEYHNSVQMLLRPVLSAHFSSQRYVSMCFESAASQCETQWTALEAAKHKHYRLSNWALYRLFLSGLTLLHLASSPTTVPVIDLDRAGRALNRCKDCLQVFIRHLPAMKAYEDTFSDLVAAWETKGRVGADQVHEARMFASGPLAQMQSQQQQHLQARQAIQQQQRAIGMAGLGGTPTPGRANSNGNGGNGANNGSPSQWFDMSMSSTPQPGQNSKQNQSQSFGGMSGIDLSNFPFSTSPSNSASYGQFGNMQQQGGFGNQQGFSMGNMGGQGQGQGQTGWGQTPGPMLGQLSGPPGGGVRDDFSSYVFTEHDSPLNLSFIHLLTMQTALIPRCQHGRHDRWIVPCHRRRSSLDGRLGPATALDGRNGQSTTARDALVSPASGCSQLDVGGRYAEHWTIRDDGSEISAAAERR